MVPRALKMQHRRSDPPLKAGELHFYVPLLPTSYLLGRLPNRLYVRHVLTSRGYCESRLLRSRQRVLKGLQSRCVGLASRALADGTMARG